MNNIKISNALNSLPLIFEKNIGQHDEKIQFALNKKECTTFFNDNEIIDEDHIVGVTKMVIPQLGRVQFFLASKFGWFTIILIPAVGVIIYDILKLFKLIKIKNKMEKLSKETDESQIEVTTKKRTRKTSSEE